MLEARAIRHRFEAVAEPDSHVFGSGGRKFGSARKFNDEPKYASPGPRFGGSGETRAPAALSSESLDEIVDAASDWLERSKGLRHALKIFASTCEDAATMSSER